MAKQTKGQKDAAGRNTVKAEDGVNRIIPQGPYDQGETEQVGGTVVNRNKNLDENSVDRHPDAEDDSEPEDHHINEMEENDKEADEEADDKKK